jgi:amidohydrolase
MGLLFYPKIEEQKDYLLELRRYFHKHPEPSLEEFGTAERIEKELAAAGIPSKRVGKTGVWGTIRGQAPDPTAQKKAILLRADIDALPIQDEKTVPYRSEKAGLMHACGHDAHTAALLGAARVLQAGRAKFAGEVRLAFQSGEEIGEGAKEFIEAGALRDLGRVFGVHMASDLPVGKIGVKAGPNNASADYFRVTVHGKSAHVSTPHQGIDALYIASQIVIALQGIVTRQTSPVESLLIGVCTLRAGTFYNIVAETAVLEGTLRAFSPELRNDTKRRIEELCEHTVAAFSSGPGGPRPRFEREWKYFTPPLINDKEGAREAAETAATIAGEENVITDRILSLAGDNFAEFLALVPGAYAYIGSGNPALPETTLPHHNCRFDIDESALLGAAGMYAEYAGRYLTQ